MVLLGWCWVVVTQALLLLLSYFSLCLGHLENNTSRRCSPGNLAIGLANACFESCSSLSWHCCPSSPQVRPPRGKASFCYSLLVVVIEGFSILGDPYSHNPLSESSCIITAEVFDILRFLLDLRML